MKQKNTFLAAVSKATNIIITTHIFPDADGIGSEIALCMALRKIGKNATCVNELELFDRYKYLDPDNVVMSYENYARAPLKEIDLFIVTDTNALPRIGNHVQDLVLISKNLLFIDHHPCPRELAAIHCIDTSMAATGELVGTLIESLGITFDAKMALPLYTAIIIDTSSFRYPTVTANTHHMISKLLSTGIRPPEAFNLINGTKRIDYMTLLGNVLSSAQISKRETVAWITLSEDLIQEHSSDPEDTHGFINHLLILENVRVACMFRQIGSKTKISMRAADTSVDVGIMAQALGGGGHNHSAATVVEGTLEKTVEETIAKIEAMLDYHDED